METRVLHLPRTVGREWKIEAPGCVVWLRATVDGGALVDVETDGDRYWAITWSRSRRTVANWCSPLSEHVSVEVIPRHCLHPKALRSYIKPGNYRCLNCGFQQFEATS